jgi:hypothetical protein
MLSGGGSSTGGRAPTAVHRALLLALLALLIGCRRSTHVPARTDGAPVAVLRPAIGGGARQAQGASRLEVEPNDTAPQAMEIGVALGTPVLVEGTLDVPGRPAEPDVDYIRLLVPGGRPARAPGRDAGRVDVPGGEASPGGPLGASRAAASDAGADVAAPAPRHIVERPRAAALALAFEVVAGGPSVVSVHFPNGQGQRSAAAEGLRHGFPLLAVEAGSSLLFELRRGEERSATSERESPALGLAPSAYRITARLVPLEGGDEREPNDQRATATPLLVVGGGAEASGFLAPAGDVDVFLLPVQALPSGELEVSLEGSAGATLEIQESSGKRIAAARPRRKAGEPLRLSLRPAGDVWIVIRSTGPVDLERQYVLRVKAGAA